MSKKIYEINNEIINLVSELYQKTLITGMPGKVHTKLYQYLSGEVDECQQLTDLFQLRSLCNQIRKICYEIGELGDNEVYMYDKE